MMFQKNNEIYLSTVISPNDILIVREWNKNNSIEYSAVLNMNLDEWGAEVFGSIEKAQAITQQQYDDNARHTLVATLNGKIVGTTSLVLDDVYGVYKGKNIRDMELGYFSRLVVSKEYRNKGIGGKLLEATDILAKKLNCKSIFLLMTEGKDSSLYQFYSQRHWGNVETCHIKGQDKFGSDIDFGECLIITRKIPSLVIGNKPK